MTFKVIWGQSQGQEMTSVHCRDYFLISWSWAQITLTQRTDFDDLYVIWRLSTQGCAFWGFCRYNSHLGIKSPKNCNFGGVNRHFQTKHMKYSNFHIIKTTAWIPSFQPNFAHQYRPPSMIRGSSRNAENKSNMAESRHIEKSKNCNITGIVLPFFV